MGVSASHDTLICPPKFFSVLEAAALIAKELKLSLKALLTDGSVRVYGNTFQPARQCYF